MTTNILKSFLNIHKVYKNQIVDTQSGNNRANNMGEGLEYFVKNLIADSFGVNSKQHKDKWQATFAFEGSKSHPPDAIIRNGDALEIKKLESLARSGEIQLNSSSLKKVLKSNSTLITKNCKNSDGGNWQQKDLFYIFGYVVNKKLKGLFFIDGSLLAADESIYQKVQDSITASLNDSNDYYLSETKELARINGVDPLKISNLRVRGMWLLKNPLGIFDYLDINIDNEFFSYLLCPKEKYNNMKLEAVIDDQYTTEVVGVKNPDNPAEDIPSMLLSFIV
ncbi:NgoPII family restriction endonuclease [Methylophilaceae bacterium]|nr:NgoPII family restriction endonuclease [Methylophilaceae bacterium]